MGAADINMPYVFMLGEKMAAQWAKKQVQMSAGGLFCRGPEPPCPVHALRAMACVHLAATSHVAVEPQLSSGRASR